MEITIDGKVVPLNFGLGYIDEANALDPMEMENMGKTDLGTMMLREKMLAGNLGSLINIIYAATWDASPRPPMAKVRDFVGNSDADTLEKLTDDLLAEMDKSGPLKWQKLQAEKAQKRAQKLEVAANRSKKS